MKKDDCIFCKIAAGEIPSATVYEDEDFRAILDLGPAATGHTLIIPKEHYEELADVEEPVAARVLSIAARLGVAMKKGLSCDGYNLVQNNGVAAGQTVMHFHMHVIPRYQGGPKIADWTPGESTREERELAAARIVEALS